MNNYLVSVVVPIYNGEKYLRECVMSIINQSYSLLEIILVDDGSSDKSRSICEDLVKMDKRVKKIFREKNGGVSECRYTGLKAATGEWLLYVDHDDTIPNDCIETFLGIAEKDKEIDIVCGNVSSEFIRDNKNDCIPTVYTGMELIKRYFEEPLLKTSHESKMYKRDLLMSVDVSEFRKRCPVAYFDDILITPIILGSADKVALLPGVFYIHREVKTSISRSNRLNTFMMEHIEAGDLMLQYFKNKQCTSSYAIKLTRYYQDILRIFCLMDFNNIEEEEKNRYESNILKYYKKYKQDFKYLSRGSLLKKSMFNLFGIQPYLWKKIVQKTYYKNYKKE